jgi:Mg/Co/Ni transporter MgtE
MTTEPASTGSANSDPDTNRSGNNDRASLDKTNGLGFFIPLLSTAVAAVGVGLIVWTMELRAATLKTTEHRTGMLTQGEFIAGIATGCLLILAVLIVLALWRQTSDPAKSTL